MSLINLITSLNPSAIINAITGVTGVNLSPQGGIKQLQYPSDLFSVDNAPYIVFTIKDAVAKNGGTKSMIALYMPPDLKVGYTSNWEGTQLQTLYYADAMKQGKKFASDATDSLAAWNNATQAMGTKAAAMMIDGAAGTQFDTERDMSLRRTVNPHDALLYKGNQFRLHTMTFQMMARNAGESQAIYDIIKEFKMAAHPSLREERYWNYPDDIDMDLRTPKMGTMFKFATSVIKDIQVSYGSNGMQSFFNDTAMPVDVTMQLTLEEKVVLTKELIDQGY